MYGILPACVYEVGMCLVSMENRRGCLGLLAVVADGAGTQTFGTGFLEVQPVLLTTVSSL